MNAKRKALAEALREAAAGLAREAEAVRHAAERFARESAEVVELLERGEQEVGEQLAGRSPGHRERSEPARTAELSAMTSHEFTSSREKLGLSVAQAANALGVNKVTVYRYEQGRPIPQTVERLLRAYLRHPRLLDE